MTIDTRRVQTQNHAEVQSQLTGIERRVEQGGLIRPGAQGPAVEDVQRRLRSFGLYEGPIDGDFGPVTTRAVRDFQTQAGITVDGTVGHETLSAIRAHTAFVKDGFETAAHKGQRGGDVRQAERMLKDLGMNPGKVDGVFDADTEAAVKSFRAGDPELGAGAGIDAHTFARMRERAAQPLAEGDRTRGVRVLEKNLKKLGDDPGTVDTSFTANTTRAVKEFQKDHGLAQTGVADADTRRAVQKAADALPPPTDATIASFSTKPPKSDYARVRVSADGDVVNKRTQEMMNRAEFIMRNKFGHKDFDFSVIQGSYTSAVGLSAGTHSGGGAMDLHTRTLPKQTVDDMVKSLRMAGFAAWSRGRGHDSFDPHIHVIAIGDRQLSPQAAAQVREYFAGGDGLIGSAPDPDANLGRDRLIPKWAQAFR